MEQRVGEVSAVGQDALETVRQQPELLAAVVIAVLAVLGAVALFRYLRRTPGDRFVRALAERERVAILMHPNPDPDAMASAMAVAEFADQVGTDAAVHYAGQIRHPENRAFQTVLDCDFARIERANEIGGAPVVLVDHNEPRGFEGAEFIDPYAVVDHHPGNGAGTAFTDVRPDRGSCSSILTEYLRDRGWSNDENADGLSVPPRLATALLYGIQSDTTSFTRGCTHAEFDAAAYLFQAADSDDLNRIANPPIDEESLDVKATAINRRVRNGSFLVSDVGTVSNLDALPPAAEELVRLEGISVAVVIGEHDGEIHLTGRSQDDRVHMGKTLQATMDVVRDASAGGHARMGGAQAPLPWGEATAGTQFVSDSPLVSDGDGGNGRDPDEFRIESPEDLERRLFDAMNGEL